MAYVVNWKNCINVNDLNKMVGWIEEEIKFATNYINSMTSLKVSIIYFEKIIDGTFLNTIDRLGLMFYMKLGLNNQRELIIQYDKFSVSGNLSHEFFSF